MDIATVARARRALESWDAKVSNPRFHAPTMRAEYDRAWDRLDAARKAFCRRDPQGYAEAFPHHVAAYVEHMPDTEARRAAAFACEMDSDLVALIRSWR